MRANSLQASSVRRRAGEARVRAIVRARSGCACEVCGQARATDMAHRIARSQGGAWRASNILHLCASCHQAQRDNRGGGDLARSLGQTLYPLAGGVPVDTELASAQTVYGRVWLLDDGSVVRRGTS